MKFAKPYKNYFGLQFLATSKDTNGKYFISETVIEPEDPGPPLHTHSNEDEGFLVIEGEITFVLENKEKVLKTGEFINIEKGDKHTWKNTSGKQVRLLVTFAPAGIEKMFVELDENGSKIRSIGEKYGTKFYV